MNKTIHISSIYYQEDIQLVERQILLIKQCYGSYLKLFSCIIRGNRKDLEALCEKHNIEYRKEPSLYKHMLLLRQSELEFFYEKKCDYLIQIDPDTACFRFNNEFYDYAGHELCYRHKEIQRLLSKVQDLPSFSRFWLSFYRPGRQLPNRRPGVVSLHLPGSIHAVNGGWTMYSRRLIELIKDRFYKGEDRWEKSYWPDGEEMFLGWYIRQVPQEISQTLKTNIGIRDEDRKIIGFCWDHYIPIIRKKHGPMAQIEIIHPLKLEGGKHFKEMMKEDEYFKPFLCYF